MNSEESASINDTANDTSSGWKTVEPKEKTILNETNQDKKRNSKTPKSLIKKDKSVDPLSAKNQKSKSIGSAKNQERSRLLDKTKDNAGRNMNMTMNRIRESNINTTEVKSIIYDKMSKEQLIQKIHELNRKIEQDQRERVKFESELRHDLVSKWARRVEVAEAHHQTELEERASQVEQLYIQKMKMIEELYQSKYEKKREEIEKNMEKLTQQLKQSEIDLKKAQDEIELLKAQLAEAAEKINDSVFLPSMLSSTKAPQTVKQERMSQSAFDTHLRLDNDDEDEDEETQGKLVNETTTEDKTFNGDASRSKPNKRKLSSNDFKNEYEDEMEFDDYDLNISKNKRQHLLINHSIQTEDVRNRSIGLEVIFEFSIFKVRKNIKINS
jgi:hypothetical protein